MATQNQQAVNSNENSNEQPQPSFFSRIFQSLPRMLFMMFLSRIVISFLTGQNSSSGGSGSVSFGTNSSTSNNAYYNLYDSSTTYSYWFYLYEKDSSGQVVIDPYLAWKIKDLQFMNWNEGPYSNSTYFFDYSYQLTNNLIKNGTLSYLACVSSTNRLPPVSMQRLNTPYYSCINHDITRYSIVKKEELHNLLDSNNKDVADLKKSTQNHQSDKPVTHINPSVTVALLFSDNQISYNTYPEPMRKHITFNHNESYYYPVLYDHKFWRLNSDFVAVNEITNSSINISLTFQPLSLIKWQIFIAQSEQNQFSFLQVQQSDQDMDNFKLLFLETNVYLLGLTFTVSILHSIFEFLAFKNDIQFWNTRKSHEGLSLHSILFNIFQSLIVFLYVLDNDANMMVIFGCLVGTVIDLWKLSKIFKISFNYTSVNGVQSRLPSVKFEYRSQEYSESKTKEFDKMAFKYLAVFLFPVLAGYSVYSLIYHTHKGWYSFVLGNIYGFLLTFGFIMMTPQLFINYKLKSVAHLPWRMMTYKALNTFVDDIFAFVIKMPTLYRLGCLRDDVIFIVFLYQKWIYPVDKSRVNEFGTSGEDYDQVQKIEANSEDGTKVKSD